MAAVTCSDLDMMFIQMRVEYSKRTAPENYSEVGGRMNPWLFYNLTERNVNGLQGGWAEMNPAWLLKRRPCLPPALNRFQPMGETYINR
jgi:hypothetical protein